MATVPAWLLVVLVVGFGLVIAAILFIVDGLQHRVEQLERLAKAHKCPVQPVPVTTNRGLSSITEEEEEEEEVV